MHVGISTACLFPMPTEYALACILALDTTTVEVFLNSPSEAEIAFVRQLRHQADDAGARIVALHPYSSEWEGASFFGQYERRFDDCAEEYKRLFQTCNELGADIMAFHGAHRFLPIDVNFYCERFGRLSEIAASFGVRLCHENVARFWGESVDFLRELRRQLPDVHLLFDIKQAVRSGYEPLTVLGAMGHNVRHVHVSDHADQADCLPPGKGRFDFAALFERLYEVDYDGALIVELYRKNFDHEEELAESEKLLRRFL